ANPQFQGEFEAGGFVTYVVVLPTDVPRVALAGAFGLKILDVSDPTMPIEIGSLSLGGDTTYEIVTLLSNDPIYVAGLAGIFSVDISDLTMPEIEQSYTDVGQGLSVAYHAFHDLALLGDRFNGLRITDADVSGGSELPQIGFYENAGFSHKAFFYGDELYVTDLSGRLRILDVADVHAGVEEIARVNDVPPNTQEVHVENDVAYVSDGDFGGTGLTILDVSDPANPQIIGGWNSGNQAFGMDLVGDILYLANGFSGLVALDVSDPADVQELGSFPMGSNTVDVVVDSAQAVAYAVNFGAGMYSIDVSDPANMQQLDAETGWGFLNAVAFGQVENQTLYSCGLVADAQEGLRVVDMEDPTDLTTFETLPTSSQARDVVGMPVLAFGRGVYCEASAVADDFVGVKYFGYLEDGAFFDSADRGIGVAYNGFVKDHIYHDVVLASGETGLYFFTGPVVFSTEGGRSDDTVKLDAPAPNPAKETSTISFRLTNPSSITLAAYDLLGRRVATLMDGVRAAGSHEVVFDVSSLPSGVYILRLTAGDQVATTKISVVH
ncbi:MAG: T9SS type A sorting domain-containing protein, partial [Rubricoccaceae bacterium]|nr:T9SS type A sorting domain-containing protein [Rubricoccaceae bacterium]